MEKLISQIRTEFGKYADEIIARIICGESVDSAIQTVVCRMDENYLK